MPNFRLSRRTVIKGAGTIAIALPWLEIMSSGRRARAASTAPARFLSVFTPGGTVIAKWRPTGSETAFTLSPILAPLEPVKDKILVIDGLTMKSAVGEQQQAGIIAWLTGTTQNGPAFTGFAGGPSIDQVLAGRISLGKKRASLQVAVRWGTGRGKGLVSPTNIANFENKTVPNPIKPSLDPAAIWQDLFGGLGGQSAPAVWDKSILDFVDRRYAKLAGRLGADDKQRLDAHLTGLRAIETQISSAARCFPPTLVDTSDYNPTSGLMSANDGSIKDLLTDAAIPKVGKLMTDMMVMAMACDLTSVGSLQWSDTEAKHTFPWLGLPETHYYYENGGGFQPIQLEKIYTWYSTQHAYLLQEMAKVDMGGHSLLDESIVFFGSELQNPATHLKDNMPFLLAGGGGGLRTGRWVTYSGESHNNLLVSLFNLFGDTRTTFGTPLYCTGPLANLV
jgi:Protein of unknown function (DUF1552)